MGTLVPNKKNLPYILMDIVLDKASLAKVPPGEGQTPEFRLIIKDMELTRKEIRKALREVYNKKGKDND